MIKIIKRCSVSIDGTEWFPADNINAMCWKRDNKIICKACLPDGDRHRNRYDNIYRYENKLFLVPNSARNIIVYDINHNNYRLIENSMTREWGEKDFKYSASVKWGHSLYLFGRRMPYIVKINMCDDTIGILGKVATHLQEKQWDSLLFFAYDYVITENGVWVLILGYGLVQLDFSDDSIHIYEIPRVNSVCRAEDNRLWISGKERIIKWSCQEGIIESLPSGDLHTAYGEAAIACDKGILKYKSSLECICIDLQSRRRWKESVPELKEDISTGECSDEMLALFFKDMRKPIFQEGDFKTLGKPLPMYFTYLRMKGREEQKLGKDNAGKWIYSRLNGC